MDVNEEMRNLRRVLAAGVLFLVSGCYSWTEVVYSVWGRTTEARVVSARIRESTSRRRSDKLVVEYTFNEDGGAVRNERVEFSADTPPPRPGSPIEIRYVAGREGYSRPLGHRQWVFMILFLFSLGVLGYFVFRMNQLANQKPTWRGRTVERH